MNEQFKELRLAAVSRHFDNPSGARVAALHELTLTIRRGEFICLLGPSGCGKTTALNCIAGLLPVTGGTISLDERRIDLLPPEKRGFGMVFQNYALFPHMTVRRNVAFGLMMRGTPADEMKARVARAFQAGAAHRPRGQAAGAAVRRPAAARRDRARDRDRAAAAADGRAAVEPRRQAAAGDARRDPPHPPPARPHHDLRHARPGRGALARRPHRGDEGRAGAAGRGTGGSVCAAREPACRALHGLSQRARAQCRRAQRRPGDARRIGARARRHREAGARPARAPASRSARRICRSAAPGRT